MKRALPRPPRFVLPSTGQSPRERKKIRSTSRARSEITITRPLLHKTRPRPSLARFSNQRNSSCPPLPRSRKHSCAPPIVQSWHARGSSCNPFHRDFFLLSFFLPFFACFGEKPDFSHYASAILHSTSSDSKWISRRWGEIGVSWTIWSNDIFDIFSEYYYCTMLRLLRRSQWRKKLLWNFMEKVYDKLSIFQKFNDSTLLFALYHSWAIYGAKFVITARLIEILIIVLILWMVYFSPPPSSRNKVAL